MPAHDWTRVHDGLFHDFHLGWTAELRRVLNRGLLPEGYEAAAEQVLRGLTPDVLTLEATAPTSTGTSNSRTVALAEAAPAVRIRQQASRQTYTANQRRLVIRHLTGNRVVALIEVISPGNKASVNEIRRLLDKTLAALNRGIHVMLLDLFPPGPRDPNGLHGLIWEELTGEVYTQPETHPLTLAAYHADAVKEAFVEPFAVGDRLTEMPLFLDGDQYIPLPLEATYSDAFASAPASVRRALERPSQP